MGMYTGLRFKGIIKKELRVVMLEIAGTGNWNLLGKTPMYDADRKEFIPLGSLSYMPDSWEYENDYEYRTGEWSFTCSLKNYFGTIQAFIGLVPYIVDSVELLEELYEEWDVSKVYKLENGQMVHIGGYCYDFETEKSKVPKFVGIDQSSQLDWTGWVENGENKLKERTSVVRSLADINQKIEEIEAQMEEVGIGKDYYGYLAGIRSGLRWAKGDLNEL